MTGRLVFQGNFLLLAAHLVQIALSTQTCSTADKGTCDEFLRQNIFRNNQGCDVLIFHNNVWQFCCNALLAAGCGDYMPQRNGRSHLARTGNQLRTRSTLANGRTQARTTVFANKPTPTDRSLQLFRGTTKPQHRRAQPNQSNNVNSQFRNVSPNHVPDTTPSTIFSSRVRQFIKIYLNKKQQQNGNNQEQQESNSNKQRDPGYRKPPDSINNEFKRTTVPFRLASSRRNPGSTRAVDRYRPWPEWMLTNTTTLTTTSIPETTPENYNYYEYEYDYDKNDSH